MGTNNGCLFNQIPAAYMIREVINTNNTFRLKYIRIISIGKFFVQYQFDSKHQDFGLLRTAKLIRKKKKVYFIIKNKKYYLRKASIVL